MTDQQKARSGLQEDLLSLYLRLNGYFVTGFIVHSSTHGRNSVEIDALAVRFPHNREPERQIVNSGYLDPSPEQIDLLICEVKSRGQQLRFNESLRESPQAMESVLRWPGLFIEDEISVIARDLLAQLQPTDPPNPHIPTVISSGNTRVRAALCSPERVSRRNNQPWFIHGDEIFSFIWQCFRPDTPRDACATQYDFTAWGKQYSPLVQYFKDENRNNPGNTRELYAYFGI